MGRRGVLAVIVIAVGILLVATVGHGQGPPATALTVSESMLATYSIKDTPSPFVPVETYPDTPPTDPEGLYDTIFFSGMEWNVKYYSYRVGPQYNYFSNRGDVVWVDEYGRLHLKIVERDGEWLASEVFTHASLGYGTYVFYLDTPVGYLDENTVLGLFLFGGDPPHYNEIDIELMYRYGLPGIQYVVQPAYRDRMFFSATESSMPATTLAFTWAPGRVTFEAYPGHVEYPFDSRYRYATWTYDGDVPEPNGESVHLNFYLYNGRVPSDGEEQEVIIRGFTFFPLYDETDSMAAE